nr:hypothetical protein [Deltaproteobacteria bacterium]
MKQPRRPRRWLRRTALGTLALIVLVVSVTLIVIHTDWGRERVRRIVEAELLVVFPGGARVGRLEGSLLGDFTVQGIELADIHGERMVRIGSMSMNLGLRQLLRKTIRIEELVADDIELYAPRTPWPPDEEPLEWDVELEDLRVRRAHIVVESAEAMTLEDVQLDSAVAVARAGTLQAGAHLRGRWRERGVPIEATVQLSGDLRPASPVFVIPLLSAQVGEVHITGAGLVIDGPRSRGLVTV